MIQCCGNPFRCKGNCVDAQPEQEPATRTPTSEFPAVKAAKKQVGQHIKYYNEMMGNEPKEPNQEPVAWISVKDALPKAVRGLSYKKSITDTVLVRHSDRPDYPITAHAVLGEGLGAGISILTEGASEYPEIAWYSASSDLNNPFGLRKDDYERYLPRIFGSKITHWMPITTPPQRKPLNMSEIVKLTQNLPDLNSISWVDLVRAVEAAHNIKD